MINITINGKAIKLEKPVTVLEAARKSGIKIPTLCWHEQLEKYGGCRLCLVEVEKMPRLQTSCTLMAVDGMVVRTETEAIADVRRGVLEFLLINHPLDCPYCDKAGECDLQDLVEKYGPTTGRFGEKKRKTPESLQDPVIVRNMERCIMCTRCVRMCEGLQGASAISVINRGGRSHVEPFSGGRYDCEYCGNCISVCPVGAMMSRLHRHSYRPWQVVSETETVCAYCGVGCTLVTQVRDDVVKRVVPKIGVGVNNGLLCSRGRFGYEFVGSKERITAPLIKKNGQFETSTWEEALSLVALKLGEIKNTHGSDAIAGIASPRCTNEDNYVFQKFMRATIGTNNIDSTARTGYAGAQNFIENIFGQGATANLIPGLANSDSVFVIGGDPSTINPILGLQVRACARRGGKVFTVGHLHGFRHYSPLELDPALFSDTVLLEGLVSALKEKKTLAGAQPILESKIREITRSAAEVGQKCGIQEKVFTNFVDALASSSTPSVVIGKELVQSSGGSYKLLLVCAINYLINGRIYLLSERANEQGLLDMGCAPELLPGYRPVEYAEFRKRYENAWNTGISAKPGLDIFGMIDAANKGVLKAMYIMGENPVFNLPKSADVEGALKKLDFLVVQEIFMSETARMADVVFPALSWAEKDGSFTNMERRIQRVRRSVSREGMEDWKIISEVSRKMGNPFDYTGAEHVFAEITRVSPLHRDLSYASLQGSDAIYPYKGEPLRGAPGEIVTQKSSNVYEKGQLYVRLERPLYHSGTLSSKAAALVNIYPEAVAKMHPQTAASLSLRDGDVVKVATKHGAVVVPLATDESLPGQVIMLSNNFEGKGAFRIMEYHIDAVTKAPCIDGNQATIEKSAAHADSGVTI